MASTTMVHIRVDEKLKREACAALDGMASAPCSCSGRKGFAFRNQGSQHKHNPSYGRRERGYAGILRVCHSTYGQHR